MICYPLQSRSQRKYNQSGHIIITNPPAPPRRISSKNSKTLKLVTLTESATNRTSEIKNQSNVDFLKNKFSNKLIRQNTHTIITDRKSSTNIKMSNIENKHKRISSAPSAVDRKISSLPSNPNKTVKKALNSKLIGTSSFRSPRRTLLPTEYTNPIYSKYEEQPNTRVIIEGSAGRRTPISNILERVTSIDKLWGSEKRNEPCQNSQNARSNSNYSSNNQAAKTAVTINSRGRDMIRTSDKLQKNKTANAKSTPCMATKFMNQQTNNKNNSSNIQINTKRSQPIKTAVVTTLRKKKNTQSVNIKPRSVPCHASCSKTSKNIITKSTNVKATKLNKSITDLGTESQFSDYTQISNFNSVDDLSWNKSISSTKSDNFFQNLFLRNLSLKPQSHFIEENNSVLQKAKMFQSYPQNYHISRSLNTYLIHRKPVSMSRFKMWDRYPSPDKIRSPRSISWPGRMHSDIRKFDSLSETCDDFGSTTSLSTVRSKSEPPNNMMFFSQTSRPKSPTVIFHKKAPHSISESCRNSMSPSKIIFTETSRPVSPKILHTRNVLIKPKNINKSPTKIIFTETSRPVSPAVSTSSTLKNEPVYKKVAREKSPAKIVLSQTSRPVSPKVMKIKSGECSKSRSHSTSPVSIRSPSYRRIHGARITIHKNEGTTTKKVIRTRSAGDAENPNLNQSRHLKYREDPDYDEYICDMENNKIRSDRFRELNRYYSYLERVGELEKTTSTCDLRHRKRDEEIIDFDRWKKIRSIERAEEELNHLYNKLRMAQSESDVLFYPRDVTDFRWTQDKERGLKIKEKSVEDLKEHFRQIGENDDMSYGIEVQKDTYKPLWRGTSVAESAFNINRRNLTDTNIEMDKGPIIKPKIICNQENTLNEIRKKLGLGNHLWSSLSMEQVDALKNQLNAIYSKDTQMKSTSDKVDDKFSISVTKDSGQKSQLQVRSNSLICSNKVPIKDSEIVKSDSIAAINYSTPSVKELKNNVNQIQMTLSENEKKRISQTLSKEVLDRIKKIDGKVIDKSTTPELNDNKKTSNFDKIMSEQQVVIPPPPPLNLNFDNSSQKRESSHQSSASETETGSSDTSNKTVIYNSPLKEVQKKVEYFESVKSITEKSNIIYHAREDSDDISKGEISDNRLITQSSNLKDNIKLNINQSQSCTNFKELFGESDKHKFLSLPPKSGRLSRSPSPRSEVIVHRRTPDTLRYSSNETIYRSRSVSPDPEQYWRAYLNLARAGEVKRLVRRFDSTSFGALRRHRSDPELSRNIFSSGCSSMDKPYEYVQGVKRVVSPVARVPLRPTNRFMPHIDIISKLAALRRRTTPRSRSAEEVPECRPGEVNRMRHRFETMSVLGQIYSSAPDVSELKDIAPYLAGPWVAHKYPRRIDNNKCVEDDNLIQGRTSPIRRGNKSKSKTKESVKLSSILKSDAFATQVFDRAAHTPSSRYEPPRAPPRPPPAAWTHRLAPYFAPHRHTVTFKGYL